MTLNQRGFFDKPDDSTSDGEMFKFIVDDAIGKRLSIVQTRLTLMVSSFNKFHLGTDMDVYVKTRFKAINHMLQNTNMNLQRVTCIEMAVTELELILGL